MSALARAFLFALVSCDMGLAFFLSENSEARASTALVSQQSALARLAEEPTGDANYADPAEADETGAGDEPFENQDAWKNLFKNPDDWKSENKPTIELFPKTDGCSCDADLSLIHRSGDTAGAPPVHIVEVRYPTQQSFPLPMQSAPAPVYVYTPANIPPQPEGVRPIRVLVTQTPLETRQCFVSQMDPMSKKTMVQKFFTEMDQLFEKVKEHKEKTEKRLNDYTLVKNILQALERFTDIDKFITDNKALTFILQLYDLIPKKQTNDGKIEPIIEENGNSFWDFVDKDGQMDTLQEAFNNIEQVAAVHHFVDTGAHVGLQVMHTGALAVGHLVQQVQHTPFVAAVTQSHAIQGALHSDGVQGGVQAFVGHVNVHSPFDSTVGTGTVHLTSTLAAKCGRNLVYSTLVTLASTMAAVELKSAERCNDFLTSRIPGTFQRRPESSRAIYTNMIEPLKEIANTYKSVCEEKEGEEEDEAEDESFICTGNVTKFHKDVQDFIQKTNDIFVKWLSDKFMGPGRELNPRQNNEELDRWHKVLQKCRDYMVSLGKIINQKIPAFLEEWYEWTPTGIAWALDAAHLSQFLAETVMNTATSERVRGVYGLDVIHTDLKNTFGLESESV